MKQSIRVICMVMLGFMMITTALFSQESQQGSQTLQIDGGQRFGMIKLQPQSCSGFFIIGPRTPVPYEDVISYSKNYTIKNNKGSSVSFSAEVLKTEIYFDPSYGYDIFPNDWGATSTGLIPDGQSILKDIVFIPRQERSFIQSQVENFDNEIDTSSIDETVDDQDEEELSSDYTSLELSGFFYVLERNTELEKWFFYNKIPHVLTTERYWLVPVGGPYNSFLFRAVLHTHFGICNLDGRD